MQPRVLRRRSEHIARALISDAVLGEPACGPVKGAVPLALSTCGQPRRETLRVDIAAGLRGHRSSGRPRVKELSKRRSVDRHGVPASGADQLIRRSVAFEQHLRRRYDHVAALTPEVDAGAGGLPRCLNAIRVCGVVGVHPTGCRLHQRLPAIHETFPASEFEGSETAHSPVHIDVYDLDGGSSPGRHSDVRFGPSRPPSADLAVVGCRVVEPVLCERPLLRWPAGEDRDSCRSKSSGAFPRRETNHSGEQLDGVHHRSRAEATDWTNEFRLLADRTSSNRSSEPARPDRSAP